MDKAKIKEKLDETKWKIEDWLKEKAIKTREWTIRNKDWLIVVVPVAASGLRFITKEAIKQHNLNKEQDLKNLYCYDMSQKHYWQLKRPLKESEWLEVEARKLNGEGLGHILNSMRVLK